MGEALWELHVQGLELGLGLGGGGLGLGEAWWTFSFIHEMLVLYL